MLADLLLASAVKCDMTGSFNLAYLLDFKFFPTRYFDKAEQLAAKHPEYYRNRHDCSSYPEKQLLSN